jgi:hypothetical protein
MKALDKQALKQWQIFCKQIAASTAIDIDETLLAQQKRIKALEKNFEQWAKYYFPNYYYSDAAPFHKAASQRILNNLEWYEVRCWSRELAKSTRTMMEVLYLTLTRKKKNVLLISNSKDNADLLINPYMAILEFNQRIVHDYNEQRSLGSWESGKFTTKPGVSFRAIGSGQSPRGSKNEEARPDVILFDDLDTDEDCRNSEAINKKWRWIEDAVIGTRSISNPTTIIFCGNIIAKDCCVVRAQNYADHFDIVNIRDANGVSTWPLKNTEAHIQRVLSKISYISQQKEYYNNPIVEGGVFKEIYYKLMPPPKSYKFLVCYIDLSYKSSSRNDYKAAVLMGRIGKEYHVLKCFLKQGTTRELAIGLINLNEYVNNNCPIYWIAEENFLQDLILKELHEGFQQLKSSIVIKGDSRKKAEKFTRIESALEPLNSNGKLFFNEAEKQNPSMQILEEQFKALAPKSRSHDDGPDACEGAKQIIDGKFFQDVPFVIGTRKHNNKRM